MATWLSPREVGEALDVVHGGDQVSEKTVEEILVADDGSPAAAVAGHTAIQIASGEQLLVHGLYVVDVTLTMDLYADYEAELGDTAELSSGEGLVSRFEERGGVVLQQLEEACRAAGVPVFVEIESGGVPELVVQEAAEAKLLALGRRGNRHSIATTHLGSNFRAIAHRTLCAIVVGGGADSTIRRVLLAYDGSDRARRALVWASTLQNTLSAEVQVLAVQEHLAEQAVHKRLDSIRDDLEQTELAGCELLIRPGEPAAEIVKLASETQADLIAMGRYRHRGLLEWFADSTVDRVLHNTSIPVLIA
jgi:nucleotide-binding universal stress UspA family protein